MYIKKNKEIKHGYNRYTKYKCRCDVCVKAKRDYKNEYRKKLKSQGIKEKSYPYIYNRTKTVRKMYNGTNLQELIELQNYKCAICKCIIDSKCHVDHNHKTGKVRGLLCRHCNMGLGFFRDNAESLKWAIEYLNNENKKS